MKNEDLLTTVKNEASKWLAGNYDNETKKQVRELLENNETELIDSFYKTLEFGTGGLRGTMGVGTNRMNIYTVGMATQGLSNYLLKNFSNLKQIKVAVAYDSRNNSELFAKTVASIFAANGFKVFLFDALRPTPELSFTIRHLACQSGVVITASHNPKEYNGYKAYWSDGGQVTSPHDKNIIAEVNKITSVEDVKFSGNEQNIEIIGQELDEVYIDNIKALSLSPDAIKRQKDLKIVYTSIHGTGVKLVPMALRAYGFENIIEVPPQNIPDGNFPTVKSPNPEEPNALDLALKKAVETDADIVVGTDPDGDRVGVAVKDDSGDFVLLNGNQTATLLIYYLLTKWKENNKLQGQEYIVKTIVTTDLLSDIAKKYGVECFEVLTGFKYIAEIIERNFGKKKFIGGGEESYGYLAGEFVRDKDAVMATALIAEAAAWAKDNNKSFFELLIDIYVEFGVYREKLISITKKGKSGAEEIATIMEKFRNSPPDSINGSDVLMIHDFEKQKSFDMISHLKYDITLPKSNVLQFILKDGSKISIRPSGTEPKIKIYFSVYDNLSSKKEYATTLKILDGKIDKIVKDLKFD
jgi:phosphoglucomutase